jgi:ribonuclease D
MGKEHMVHLIDSELAIEKLLRPFIENPETEFFGIDAEWDMTFTAEMGTLCLIQMTSETQTMLIDIHTFRKQYRWTQERFFDLFKLIFDHSKKIYGKF